MRAAAFLALTGLSGCMFIVSKDRKSEVRRVEQWHDLVPLGQPVPQVAGQVRGSGVDVAVTWKQLCDITGDLVIEDRVHTGATVKVYDPCGGSGSDGCGYLLVFAVLAAPVTLAVSGLITAGVVAGADDRMEQRTQPLPTKRVPCDRPGANARVIVAAPGRAPIEVTMDDKGRAFVELGDPKVALLATVQLAP